LDGILASERSITASKDHVVAGLIEKRRELAGIIDQMQRQLDQYRADLTHIDGVLRVLASDLDPEMIWPKRAYRRNRYFARNELSRLCLGVLRTAAGELLSTDDIADRVIAAKSFDAGESCAQRFVNRSGQSSSGFTAAAQSRTSARRALANGGWPGLSWALTTCFCRKRR
jgi:hypothetical protein